MVAGPYIKERLPNGLRVICEEIPYVRSVTAGIWVGAGSRYEEENSGISHFIEHLLFKGTSTRSAREIAETMDSVGGQLNAFTSKEHTCFYARVLDQHFSVAVDLLSDMVLRSRFDPDDIAKEKGIIVEEIKMYEDAPDELVHDLFAQNIWAEHPLGRNIVGSAGIINSLSRQDVLKYFKEHYTPDNIVVAVAGNVSPARVVEEVGRAMGGMTGKGAPVNQPSPAVRPGVSVKTKDLEQVHICLGTRGVPQDHDDMYPLYVLNNTLGGGQSSRLFQKIREERGLAYSVYSYLSSYRDAGLFTVYAGMSPQYAEEVVDIILRELGSVRDRGLTDDELRRAKEQMKGQLMLSLESTSNRMSRLGRSELALGRILSPDEVIEKLNAVEMGDIRRLTSELLDEGKLALSAVGPAPETLSSRQLRIP